jgi:NAD(P)-dependent dehydrogenase (short-subunit alcohol dehydrogenase family)
MNSGGDQARPLRHILGCRFGIPELIKAGGGSVINMSSNVALMGVASRDCYTAAKGGIAAITRSLAVAYAHNEFASMRLRHRRR